MLMAGSIISVVFPFILPSRDDFPSKNVVKKKKKRMGCYQCFQKSKCSCFSVPGKPTMLISTTIGNTALIQWQPPKEMVGEHLGYQLHYKRVEEEAFFTKDFRQTDDHFTVTGLHKGATYVFKLCARNRAGYGEEHVKEISTPEDVPGSYPQNLSVTGLTASSTNLAWSPPPLAERNGKIVKYVVVYRDINSPHNSSNSTSETHMSVQGLQPDTTYDIRVQAFTSKGAGPLSPSIQSRTMSSSVPGEELYVFLTHKNLSPNTFSHRLTVSKGDT